MPLPLPSQYPYVLCWVSQDTYRQGLKTSDGKLLTAEGNRDRSGLKVPGDRDSRQARYPSPRSLNIPGSQPVMGREGQGHLLSNNPAGCLDGLLKPRRQKMWPILLYSPSPTSRTRPQIIRPKDQGSGWGKGRGEEAHCQWGPGIGEGEMKGSLEF